MSKTFCPLPWNSINIRNNGDLRICCNANSYTKNRGIIRKEDDTPYNAKIDNLKDARNSDLSKEIRSTMLKGEWHSECERCRQEEKNGIRSRRIMESEDWDLTYEKAWQTTDEDGTINVDDHPLDYFDIRYGNFCNLKCRMCGPTDSDQWYDDYVKIYNKTEYKDTHEQIKLKKDVKGKWTTNQYDWFKDDNLFWKNFKEYTKDAKKLYIVGGEPLIIEEHIDSLQLLIDNGSAKNIEIEYNSNLTTVSTRILELWKHFKQIRIGASIDGCKNVFEYQRYGTNWERVWKNLNKIQNNNDINFKCWFAFTITPFNVFHFPEFMKWRLEESGLTKFNPLSGVRPIVSFHMCHSPKYYNIKVLPHDIKEKVIEHYTEYKDWIHKSNHDDYIKKTFTKYLNNVQKFMLSEDYSDGECWSGRTWLQEFIHLTINLDKIRNQNVLEVVPQFESLFNAYNK